jgi:two-component system, chemotaxis family, sensor kinase CheA
VKEKGKFSSEIESLLINLRSAILELETLSDPKQGLEMIIENINMLAEISGLYGINSILQASNKVSDLLSATKKAGGETNSGFKELISKIDPLIQVLIKDPLLSKATTKAIHQDFLAMVEIRMNQIGVKTEDESGKLPTAKFQEVFIEEAFDLINQLEEKMLQLESDPSDITMIDQIFRIMHTLKGNSNMFGYRYLGEITHELENIYDSMRSKKVALSRVILENTFQCVDHFRNLINDPELGNSSVREQHQVMLREIKSILATDQSANNDDLQMKPQKGTNEPHTFYIYFKPETDIFHDGTNPLYFIDDLHEMGECLVMPVFDSQVLALGFDPEKCYTVWHILLVTTGTEEDIREHFLFLNEKSQPVIKNLAAENLLTNQDFLGDFTIHSATNLQQLELDVHTFIDEEKVILQAHTDSKDARDSIASVRVASQKIDLMMNLISELVTKQAELSMLVTGCEDQRLVEVAESIENISRDLRDNAFSISLIPLEKSVLRFQRLVRDVAKRFDKKINFVVEGKDTELDKTIIEKIVDPIMHILRNSIDHGIEKPKERAKKGKPETGIILLKAYPSGTHVVIEISDDGAGINLERVKETAVKKGMIGTHEQITNDDLLRLIVSPGFSTAENISEVSGRGVGMDVVNQKITEIRGELEVQTEKDKGTTITIKLPLTISIIDSLLVKVAGEYFLVPLSVVERCAEIKAATLAKTDNNYVVLLGEYIPFLDLRDEFIIEGERPAVQQILLIKFKEDKVGLIVDEVIGNYQAVLKALGDAYKRQEIISGASIMGSGEVALVIDTNKIIQEFNQRNEIKIAAMA